MKKSTNLNKTIYLGVLILVTMSFDSSGSTKVDLFSGKIGVCTSYAQSGVLIDNGYSFVEESVGRFLVPTKDESDFEEILSDAKNHSLPVIACNSFIPGSLKSVGPDAVHPEILTYVETAFRRANKAGVEIIVFGSGGSRFIPEEFSRDEARAQFIDLCKQIAPIARENNVTVVLEPLNTQECNFINSVAEGGEIVKEVNHPNFLLLADIYHMKMENESADNILKYGNLIKHVHIAEKQERAVPGTHDEDFRPYFNALKKINYKGRISIEARWNDFEAQVPVAIKTIMTQVKH